MIKLSCVLHFVIKTYKTAESQRKPKGKVMIPKLFLSFSNFLNVRKFRKKF